MQLHLALSLFVACTLAVGCANPPKKQDLAVPSVRQTFVLNEPVSLVASVGVGYRVEYGAVPGSYTSERESDQGTYYFGDGRAIWHTHEALQKTPRLLYGGVFVQKSSTQPPTLFYVFEKDTVTTENLNSYIDSRIVQTAATPASNAPAGGVGASIAGNIVAGAVVTAIIDAAVGQLINAPEPLAPREVGKVATALRQTVRAASTPSK